MVLSTLSSCCLVPHSDSCFPPQSSGPPQHATVFLPDWAPENLCTSVLPLPWALGAHALLPCLLFNNKNVSNFLHSCPPPCIVPCRVFFFFPSRCRVYVSLKHFLLDPFKFSVSCSVWLKTAEAVSCWFAASQETLPPPGEQAWASMLGHRVHEEDWGRPAYSHLTPNMRGNPA